MKKEEARKTGTATLIKRFLPYYKQYAGVVALDLFCAALTTVCELVLPMMVRYITDMGMNNLQALTVKTVLVIGVLYLVLRIIDTAANYYMTSIGHIMGTRIETKMRSDLFGHLQRLQFAYYDETKVGTLMSRITNDLFEVTEFAHHCPEEFFIAGIKVIASFVILSNINLWLTLIVFAVIPFMLIVCGPFRHRMKEGFRESKVVIGEINAQVEDSLLGIRVVKSFANEPVEKDKFEQGNGKFLAVKRQIYHAMAGFHATIRLFDGLMYITVVVAGALFMIGGKVTPADLVAFLLYVSTLLTTVRRIIEFSEQFYRGMTGIERFTEILDAPVTIDDKPDAEVLTDVRGDVDFCDVSFRYSAEGREVLSHLNLHVKAGQTMALVGPSGGGKTTICGLLPRFYEVCDGSIRLDGKDIQNVTLESLRNAIGVVQQDVYLFSGTVYENIVYGRPDATPEEVKEAARLAGAAEFIEALPDGYDTYVGERGVKLSGGQKQRISIARVFLKDPPVLILDEATSALDNESERLVQESLERLAKGRTTFIVAHRLTTIRNADVIAVVTEDGIAEMGSHQELIQNDGAYAALYRLYE
ncbi:MAG: ABC transporter ATP-binding protein [Clostridia bacterium]|nr:ABC transporter ATP-binding protein [Clostridia bacterium]